MNILKVGNLVVFLYSFSKSVEDGLHFRSRVGVVAVRAPYAFLRSPVVFFIFYHVIRRIGDEQQVANIRVVPVVPLFRGVFFFVDFQEVFFVREISFQIFIYSLFIVFIFKLNMAVNSIFDEIFLVF